MGMSAIRLKVYLMCKLQFSSHNGVCSSNSSSDSVRARLLVRKLALKRVAEVEADTLVGGVIRAFSDEMNLLRLVSECKDLDKELGMETNLTSRILRNGIQALVRVMCHHGHGFRPCPLCDCSRWSHDSLLGHLLVLHTNSLGLVEAGSMEVVISSVADLQLTKFINLFTLMYYCICTAVLLGGMSVIDY